MDIKGAWNLSMLLDAGYMVKVHSCYVDSEVHCINLLDKNGDIAVSEDEVVTATFDSEVFSGENLLEYDVCDITVMKPCIRWQGNIHHLKSELERMACQDGYMDAFLDEYEKQPSLLRNF